MTPKWLIDIRTAFISPAPYVSWVIATVVLTVSGSFGAIQPLPLDQRLILFGSVVALLLIWGIVARIVVQHIFPAMGFWVASTLVILSSAVVLAPAVHGLAHWLTGLDGHSSHGWGIVALLIVCLGYAAALFRWLLSDEPRPRPQAPVADSPVPAEKAEAPTPRLLRRLEPALQGSLIRVSGKNHHVEVVTETGASLLLLRLSDALAELDGAEGLQVHRSHWVATAAITGNRTVSGRAHLVLSDGSLVPVSRSQRAEVERRGFL
ncbi:MAG: hypothetical protein RLZZ528_2387 [Pseudomonadota bacterium]